MPDTSPSDFPQSEVTPAIVHLVNEHREWPESLSAWTEPLLKLDDGGDLPEDSIESLFNSPRAAFGVELTFQRIRRALATDACLPQYGPDSKAAILGPFAGDILQDRIPELEVHYEVDYARGAYLCQHEVPGRRLLPQYGNATSVLCAPLKLDESMVQSILVSSPDCSDDSSPSPSRFSLHRDAGPWEGEESPDDEDISMKETSYEDDDMEDGGNPLFRVLRDLGEHQSSAGEEDATQTSPLKNLHFLAHHKRNHSRVSLPLLCVAPRKEIYDVLASALLHRRVFFVFDPIIGLTFDPEASRMQVIFAWLENSDSHFCFDMHTAHAPLLDQIDASCGWFDMSTYSSIVSLATYLSRIIPLLLDAISEARENAPSLPEDPLRVWRLDALPLNCEERADDRLDLWLTQVANQYSPLENSQPTSSMPPQVKKKPQAQTALTFVPVFLRLVYIRLNLVPSGRSGTDTKSEQSLQVPDGKPSSSPAVTRVKKTGKSPSASESAKETQTTHLATNILAERLQYYTSWIDETFEAGTDDQVLHNWFSKILQGVRKEIMDLRFTPGKKLEHEIHPVKLGPDGRFVSVPPNGQEGSINDVFYELQALHDAEAEYRGHLGMTQRGVMNEAEEKEVIALLPVIVFLSQRAKIHNGLEETSEATGRFPWDGFLELLANTETIVKREVQLPMSRNTWADLKIGDPQFDGRNKLHTSFTDALTAARAQVLSLKGPKVDLQEPKEATSTDESFREDAKVFYKTKQGILEEDINKRYLDLTHKLAEWNNIEQDEESIIYRAVRVFHYSIADSCAAAVVSVQGLKAIDQLFLAKAKTAAKPDVPLKDSKLLRRSPGLSLTRHVSRAVKDGKIPACSAIAKEETAPQQRNITPAPAPIQDASNAEAIEGPQDPRLAIPYIFVENKQDDVELTEQGIRQSEFYINSSARYLACLGVYGMPIFSIGTVGSSGRLLCGVAHKVDNFVDLQRPLDHDPKEVNKKEENLVNNHPDNVAVVMADTNCPEWDVAVPREALSLAIFLVCLRTRYQPKLVKAFKDGAPRLVEDVNKVLSGSKGDDVEAANKRFRWRVMDQMSEEPYKPIYDKLQADKKRKAEAESDMKK